MRLRIQTGINPHWDQPEEYDTFTDSDEETQDSSSTATTETTVPQTQPIINPYTAAPRNVQPRTILSTLTSWIRTNQNPHNPPQPPSVVTILESAPEIRNPTYTQPPLQTDTENFSWGDSFQKPKPLNTFRLFSKNVNTLSTHTDYLQWKATAHVLQQYEVDALAVQETNLAWNKPIKHCI